MGLTYEEQLIHHIKNSIRAIHLGIEPKNTKAEIALNRLKTCNVGLYDDYKVKYLKSIKDYNNKNEVKQRKTYKNLIGDVS